VRRFCNTTNLESGADRLSDPDDFATWLSEQGHPTFRASEADLADCIQLREAIRNAATCHRSGDDDSDALADLEHSVRRARFVIRRTDAGLATTIAPGQSPVSQFVGSIALAVAGATTDGTWPRLKACRRCGWVVYDNSKNRSAQWCSMSACGGRSKVQQHRARQRETGARAGSKRRSSGRIDDQQPFGSSVAR
jgi:predicted RNA-binding Zn ribbon-like protein